MAILGIDLGTSNSLVGYYRDSQVNLIPNVFNEYLTPSVVGINEQGELLIGKLAKERQILDSKNTFSTFKRWISTNKKYKHKDKSYSPTDLSSFILKQLKNDAQEFLNEECNQAIISVPAYFNNLQRQCTIEAATLAGLEVIKLINEPTAAALTHGIHEFEDDSMIVVLDLGGGTFDVSIMEMFDGILQVLSIAGDNLLGGEDFTNIIIEDFIEKNKILYGSLSLIQKANLYQQCETIKKKH